MPTLFQESGHTSRQLFLDPVHPSILGHRLVGEEAARILARWAQGVPIERNPAPLAQPSYSDPFSRQKDGSRRAQTDAAKKTTVRSTPQPRNKNPTFELLGCTSSFRQATAQGDIACARAGKGLSFVSIEIDVPSSQAALASPRLFVMQTELTQGFYKRLLPDAKVPACTPQNNLAEPAAGQPLYCVSFTEAIQLANLVSKKAGLSPCYKIATDRISMPEGVRCTGYRLPTMVEWRALQGSDTPPLETHAWCAKNSDGRTHPVAEKQPSPSLLYDTFGNVSEWIWSTTESPSPSTPKRHAIGGSAGDSAESLRTQDGQALSNDQGDEGTGFRLVRTIP